MMKHNKSKETGHKSSHSGNKLKVGTAVGAIAVISGLGAFGVNYTDRMDWNSQANRATEKEATFIDDQRTNKKLACISKVVLMAGVKLYANPENISQSILFEKNKSNETYTVPKGDEVISDGSWNIPNGVYEGWAPMNIISPIAASKPSFYKANTNEADFKSTMQIALTTDWVHLYPDEGSVLASQSNTGENCNINRAGQTIEDGTNDVMNYAIVVPVDSPGVIDRMSSTIR